MKTRLDTIMEEAELELGPQSAGLSAADEEWEGEVNRRSREYIRWVQRSLNRVLGTTLAVDGIAGPATRSATRRFQERFLLKADGVVGPQTEAVLISTSASVPPSSSSAPSGSRLPPPATPSSGTQSGGPNCDISYPVSPGQDFGPKFKSGRPPGLPASARLTSESGAAIPHVRRLAAATGQGSVFVETVAGLARTESGGRFAMPAHIFNALPGSLRGGRRLITAWGAFQFNRDAWRDLRRRIAGTTIASTSFPWQATACEEIQYPVARYSQLFAAVRQAGGSEIAAARGIRLWHRSPAAHRKYLEAGRSLGFASAWSRVSSQHRGTIDRRLRETGVL